MNRLPSAFNTRIFRRYMNEKDLFDLYESYKEHRYSQKSTFTPTASDLTIYKEHVTGKIDKNAAKKRWGVKSGSAYLLRMSVCGRELYLAKN